MATSGGDPTHSAQMSRIYLFDTARLGAYGAKPYLHHSHVEVDEHGVAFLVVEGKRVISTRSLPELLRRLCVDEQALEVAATG